MERAVYVGRTRKSGIHRATQPAGGDKADPEDQHRSSEARQELRRPDPGQIGEVSEELCVEIHMYALLCGRNHCRADRLGRPREGIGNAVPDSTFAGPLRPADVLFWIRTLLTPQKGVASIAWRGRS